MKKLISAAIFFLAAAALFISTGCTAGKLNLAKYDNWFNTNQDSLKAGIHLTTALLLNGNSAKAQRITASVQKLQKNIPVDLAIPANTINDYLTASLVKYVDPVDAIIIKDWTKPLQDRVLDTLGVLNMKDPNTQLIEVNMLLSWVTDVSSIIK